MDHSRHIGIFDARLHPITLIGAGGIGALTAVVLAKMGVPAIDIYDFDTVDPENVSTQFYSWMDVGNEKVVALAVQIKHMNNDVIVNPHHLKVTKEIDFDLSAPIIISAVDSLTARKEIWAALQRASWGHYIDARMAAESFQAYVVESEDRDWYDQALSRVDEADVEPLPCTAKATIYTAATAAGHIGSLVRQIITGDPIPRRIVHDIIQGQLLTL
jgi:molybdopterin/thiamine biosynthesis adenylyltransferase